MSAGNDIEALGGRWPELVRFIMARARPSLSSLGHTVIAANGLEDDAWQDFLSGLLAAIAARLGTEDRLQPLAATALSLLGDADAIRAAVADSVPAVLARRLRGGPVADVLAPLHAGMRRGLASARRGMAGIGAHEDRVWKRLDHLSRRFLADNQMAFASRCEWPFFAAFARHLKANHLADSGVVTGVETIAWYFRRHCPDCGSSGFGVDEDGNDVEPPPLPVGELPGHAQASAGLETCLQGLDAEALAMVNVHFSLDGVIEMSARAWRERNQVTRHRYERTIEQALADLRECLEARIVNDLPPEFQMHSSWLAFQPYIEDSGDPQS